jgi:hypothetical protein
MEPRDKAADQRLRREYGITLDQYNQLLAHQGHACAICRTPVIPGKPRLHVDHDHSSGEIRGLLCWPCNKAIAAFRDDVARLQAAAAYVMSPPVRDVLGPTFTVPGRVGTKKRAKLLRDLQR